MSKQKSQNKIHIVLGLGSSGINAAKLLKSEGHNVLVLENFSNQKLLDISQKMRAEGINVMLLDEPLHINNFKPWIGRIDSIIVSPGIDWEHKTLKELRSINITMRGEKIGMIRFGSRADIYFNNYTPLIKINQRTIAGETLIAKK